MIALRLHPNGSLRLHDEPEPVPAQGEVLLQVAAIGLCGSDRHWLLDGGIGDARLDAPLILGHEFCAVARSGSLRGRLVAADPTITCGRCRPCRSGRENLCLDQRFAGYSGTDGALRERMAWPERLLYPLAESVEPGDGALVEPLAVAVNALQPAGDLRGRRIGVVGCGPLGLLIVSLAGRSGAATIVAADPLDQRLTAAQGRGAVAIGGGNEDELELDVVFEVAGEDSAVDRAMRWVAPGGQLILVGIPPDDRTSFVASIARRKGLTFRLVRRSTSASFEAAVALAEQGSLDLASLITERVPLSEAQIAFDALAARSGIKVVVEPTVALL